MHTVDLIHRNDPLSVVNAAIIPEYSDLLNNEMLNWDGNYAGEKSYDVDRAGYSHLKKHFENNGHNLQTIDQLEIEQIDLCIFVDSGFSYLKSLMNREDRPVLVYLMREPPSYNPVNSEANLHRWKCVFDKVLTWNPTFSKKYNRVSHYIWPQFIESHYTPLNFEEKKLLVNISSRKHSSHPSELYSAREDIIQYYEENHPNSFSLYGPGWSSRFDKNAIYNHGILSPVRANKTHRGSVKLSKKPQIYKKYKFALCFENMSGMNGWVTEKIFDCFRSGTVPIYWGAEDISEYMPEKSYIDYREFCHPEDLHNFITSMDVKEYKKYRYNGMEFINDNSHRFSPENFSNTIYEECMNTEKTQISWIPPNIDDKIDLLGGIEELTEHSAKYGSKEYTKTFFSSCIHNPKIIYEKPSVLTHAIKNILPL